MPETDDQPAVKYDSGDFSKYFDLILILIDWGRQGPTDRGTPALFHNSTSASNVSSLDYFYATGKFYAEDSLIYMVVNENNWDPIPLSEMNDTGLASAVDGFAKAFYSSILLDLGSPSPLTDADSITYLLSQRNASVLGVKAGRAVDTFQDEMAPLNTTAAQLSLQYVCSVPKQKERFSMVISIIIADLVLLSAFWQFLNWAATKWLSSQTPNWNHCPGCERPADSWKFVSTPKTDDESVQLVLQRPNDSRVDNW